MGVLVKFKISDRPFQVGRRGNHHDARTLHRVVSEATLLLRIHSKSQVRFTVFSKCNAIIKMERTKDQCEYAA